MDLPTNTPSEVHSYVYNVPAYDERTEGVGSIPQISASRGASLNYMSLPPSTSSAVSVHPAYNERTAAVGSIPQSYPSRGASSNYMDLSQSTSAYEGRYNVSEYDEKTARMGFPQSTSYAVPGQERTVGMDLLTLYAPPRTLRYPFSAINRLDSDLVPSSSSAGHAYGEIHNVPTYDEGIARINSPLPSTSSAEPYEEIFNVPAYNERTAAERNIFENERLIEHLREVLSIKILEENTEHSPQSNIERDSQVLLSEVYVEYPGFLGAKKCIEPTPEENNFFEFSKAILLGKNTSLSLDDFSEIHPDIMVTAKVFLEFICVENTLCTDPKLILKFLTVIAAMFSNSKLVLNEMQIVLIVKFLLHCLFVEINHVKHGEFRQIVAQMLIMFTNGSSFISKKLYTDIVEHFNKKIDYFPLNLYHWNAILLTVEFMGVSAIQSIVIPNFSDICKLLDESLKSLEYYNSKKLVSMYKQTTKLNVCTSSQKKERKKFNSAMKTYLDAANVHALLLKLCTILIEDIIKEDIRIKKRVIYIPKEIDDLLEEEEITEPKPVKYEFDHKKHKSFIDNCFQYFGDALNARISSVFIEYERSNYMKADFFKQKYNLCPINNRYLEFEKTFDLYKGKQKKSRMSNKSNLQTTLKQFHNSQKTFVFMNPPNHRLGSILTTLGEGKAKKKCRISGLSKQDEVLSNVEESKQYLTSLQNVPEPWLRVLRKRYELQHRVRPKHWKFTGNLETYI